MLRTNRFKTLRIAFHYRKNARSARTSNKSHQKESLVQDMKHKI